VVISSAQLDDGPEGAQAYLRQQPARI